MSKSSWRRVFLVLGAALLLGGYGMSAASNGGIDVYSGGIDMHSNSISNLADPSSAQDAATRSWVNTNDDYEADTNTDASTTCTGADYLAGDGSCNADSYEADTNTNTQLDDESASSAVDMSGNDLNDVSDVNTDDIKTDNLNVYQDSNIKVGTDLDMQNSDIRSINDLQFSGGESIDGSNSEISVVSDDSSELKVGASHVEVINGVIYISDDTSTSNRCAFNDGKITCDGSKNWVHRLNKTHEAVYSSQESPQVRAVYEGNATVTNGQVNVTLPSHFEKTVSDSKPMLRAQVTAHSPVAVGVTARSDSWLVIETAGLETVDVDYRITGIREGYEDKDVVRKKK